MSPGISVRPESSTRAAADALIGRSATSLTHSPSMRTSMPPLSSPRRGSRKRPPENRKEDMGGLLRASRIGAPAYVRKPFQPTRRASRSQGCNGTAMASACEILQPFQQIGRRHEQRLGFPGLRILPLPLQFGGRQLNLICLLPQSCSVLMAAGAIQQARGNVEMEPFLGVVRGKFSQSRVPFGRAYLGRLFGQPFERLAMLVVTRARLQKFVSNPERRQKNSLSVSRT